jgi:hypothetical protein
MVVYGVCTLVPAALPRPLPAVLRTWARTYAAEDLQTSLDAVENAVRVQSAPGWDGGPGYVHVTAVYPRASLC